MQIICNNCSNELRFPNHQPLVICPHCYTHLQIEETDNTITATIVENPDLNNPLFISLNQLSMIQSFTPLYNLLHLELEYNEAMEEHFFHSLLIGKPFRPILTRGIFRLLVGLFFIIFFLTPNVFNWFSIIFIAYSGFLVFVGAKEIIKAWQFRQFEKYYFEEQTQLNEAIKSINLSDNLNNIYFSYIQNVEKNVTLRANYFYMTLFNRIKINIGTPLLSQAFRLLIIVGLFVAFLIGFEEIPTIFVLLITIIIGILMMLFFVILKKSNTYTSQYLTLLNHRKKIIDDLKRHLQQ